MTIYEIGSLCEDCLRHGLQNNLKAFYINLDEQIVKCESSSCMFPYLRKPIITDLTNSKPSENILFLDEFIQQSLQKIDDTPAKQEIQKYTAKMDVNSTDMYDFSAIFSDHHIKTEVKETPQMFHIIKQELNTQSDVFESQTIQNNGNPNDLKSNATNNSKKQQKQPLQKSRISKCLSDVKTASKSSNAKKQKALSEKIEPVLVIEPHSGKSMRPLDLIKRYIKNK